MKTLIMIILLAAPALASDYYQMEQADALKRIARAEEMRNAVGEPEPQTITVNEAGYGCSWAQMYSNGKPKWFKADDGYHQIWLKVCDDDPKDLK